MCRVLEMEGVKVQQPDRVETEREGSAHHNLLLPLITSMLMPK